MVVEIEEVLQPQSRLRSELRTAWLRQRAIRGDWQEFLELYSPQTDPLLRCQYLSSRLRLQDGDKLDEVAKRLWLVGTAQPPERDPVFEVLIERSRALAAVDQRLDEALEWLDEINPEPVDARTQHPRLRGVLDTCAICFRGCTLRYPQPGSQ